MRLLAVLKARARGACKLKRIKRSCAIVLSRGMLGTPELFADVVVHCSGHQGCFDISLLLISVQAFYPSGRSTWWNNKFAGVPFVQEICDPRSQLFFLLGPVIQAGPYAVIRDGSCFNCSNI